MARRRVHLKHQNAVKGSTVLVPESIRRTENTVLRAAANEIASGLTRPREQDGGGKVGSLSLPLAMWQIYREKSETGTTATRIAIRPHGKSVHIMVSLPAGPNRAA